MNSTTKSEKFIIGKIEIFIYLIYYKQIQIQKNNWKLPISNVKLLTFGREILDISFWLDFIQ